MAERVLVFGASGFIGGYLYDLLAGAGFQVTGTCYNRPVSRLVSLNLLDEKAVGTLLHEVRPDKVIFLSGIKDVERCERAPAHAIDLNFQTVCNYLDACNRTEIFPVTLFFSTDYVFDGRRGAYRSGDVVGPCTVYGAFKLLAEKLLMSSGLRGVVLRVSAVMARNGGFFQWLERQLTYADSVSLYDNVYFSPTSIGRLCRYVIDFSGASVFAGMKVVHLSDGYRMSRFQFGSAVAASMGVPATLLKRGMADFSATTLQADLSLVPEGFEDFLDPGEWEGLGDIY